MDFLKVDSITIPNQNDWGFTEDEWSNFKIDCWLALNQKPNPETQKYHYWDAITWEEVISDTPIAATITIGNNY